MSDYHNAVMAAQAADDAWTAELSRVYRRQAGDARYDDRGAATPRLKQLRDAYHRASERRQTAFRATSIYPHGA
jgi:hypothetical protein